MAILLRIYGYEVEMATTGQTALHMAEVAAPDVVLLDIGLPELDGWQVPARLRQAPWLKNRPLGIAITSYGEQLARLRSYQEGIGMHLVKPVSMDELQRTLTRFQTVSMPSAHRIPASHAKALYQPVGRLQRLSDQIRIERCARRVLAKAKRSEELARQTEKLLVQGRSQLNAIRVHCQRVASFLAQAS